jgi:pimeloyl-ACP methyl ester carboxylesterase
MADFVLVHGAWHGGWCWRDVVPHLARAGHRVHAVTLTGLGERAHLMTPAITLETHITDVIAAIEAEEMQQVVLVVHSYAGMLGTAVADRLPGRLRHLVYIDAVLPEPGERWSSTHTSATREARLAAAQASADFSFPPPDAAIFGLAGEQYDWVARRQTPHPGHTYQSALDFDVRRVASVPRTFIDCTEPALATIDASRRRVADPDFWGGAWRGGGGARVVTMKIGHDAMIIDPEGLSRVLLDCC